MKHYTVNCELNSESVFANLPIKELSKTQCNRVSLQFTDRVFGIDSGLSLSVKGNLRANTEFWKSIGAPYFILLIIENGYKLPFASLPEPVKLRNNKSARFHADMWTKPSMSLFSLGVSA